MAAGVLQNLGFVAAQRGDVPLALEFYERAQLTWEPLGGTRYALLELDRCQLLLATGLVREARASADRALSALEDTGMEAEAAEALLQRAEVALAERDWATAGSAAERALRAFAAQRRPTWAALARYAAVRAAWGARRASAPAAAPRRSGRRRRAGAGSGPRPVRRRRCSRGAAAPRPSSNAPAGRRGPSTPGCSPAASRSTSTVRARRATSSRSPAAHASTVPPPSASPAGTPRRCTASRPGGRARRGAPSPAGCARSTSTARCSAQPSCARTRPRRPTSSPRSGCASRSRAAARAPRSHPSSAPAARAAQLPPVRPPSDPALAAKLGELRAVVALAGEEVRAGRPSARLVARQTELEHQIRRRLLQVRGSGRLEAAASPSLGALRAALGERALIEYLSLDGALHAVVVTARRVRLRRARPGRRRRARARAAALRLRRLAAAHGAARIAETHRANARAAAAGLRGAAARAAAAARRATPSS